MSVTITTVIGDKPHRVVLTPRTVKDRLRGLVIDNFVLELRDFDPRDVETLRHLLPELVETMSGLVAKTPA